MSIDTNRIERDYTKFLPLVRTRKGESIFVPRFIYQSLLRETKLTKDDAKKVTEYLAANVLRIEDGKNVSIDGPLPHRGVVKHQNCSRKTRTKLNLKIGEDKIIRELSVF